MELAQGLEVAAKNARRDKGQQKTRSCDWKMSPEENIYSCESRDTSVASVAFFFGVER